MIPLGQVSNFMVVEDLLGQEVLNSLLIISKMFAFVGINILFICDASRLLFWVEVATGSGE